MTTNPATFKPPGTTVIPLAPFWRAKTLDELKHREWEAVCDRCGLCCLVKLQDADSGTVVYTDVACNYLDIDTCRCTVYGCRQERVSECLQLTPENLSQVNWLPPTCGYRLLREGRPLPPWHPLVSGHGRSVHQALCSARHIAVAPDQISDQELVNHVIDLFAEAPFLPSLVRELGL